MESLKYMNTVSKFFTTEKWDEITEYEHVRACNVYHNYLNLREIDPNTKPPYFVVEWEEREATRKAKINVKPTSPEKTTNMTVQRKSVDTIFNLSLHGTLTADNNKRTVIVEESPYNSPKKSKPSRGKFRIQSGQSMSVEESSRTFDVMDALGVSIEIEETDWEDEEREEMPAMSALRTSSTVTSRYPRRNRIDVNYAEADVPNDDEMIFCDKCSEEFHLKCKLHGSLPTIPDNEIPADPDDRTRAERTAPVAFLRVALSLIPSAGRGVFANTDLSSGWRFGPYDGERCPGNNASGYSWQIYGNNRIFLECVDASNPGLSNWMRYVNCARHNSEQNLVAFQFKGEMYYRTNKAIPKDSELLVWYGNEYARKLNIDVDGYHKAIKQPLPLLQRNGEFGCPYCLIHFTADNFLQRHIKHCRAKWKKPPSGNRMDTRVESSIAHISDTDNNNNDFIKPADDKPYKCNECGYSSALSCNLRRHKLTHSGLKPYKCNECEYSCNHSVSLRTHKLTHSGVKPYKCNECGYSCTQSSNLRTHKLTHSGVKPYKCNECDYSSARSCHLRTHKLTHSGVKPYKCNECGYSCTQSCALRTHKLTHSGMKPYKCNECGYSSALSCNLRRHKLTHSGLKPYKCNECEYSCNHSVSLRTHKLTHSGVKPYKCNECGYSCTQSSNLRTHQLTHSGVKPYKCNECDYSSARSCHLRTHKLTHSGVKPYKCNECGYSCTQSCALRTHKLTHSGMKPYKCNECGYSCTQSCALRTHKLTHSGVKPYKCNECGYSCTQSCALRTHKLTHSGMKPYKCNECGYSCTQSSNLRTHKLTHSGVKSYKCNECGYSSAVSCNLRTHKLTHSGVKPYV